MPDQRAGAASSPVSGRKRLRQIMCVVCIVAAAAKISIQGVPVPLTQPREGLVSIGRGAIQRREDEAPVSGGEPVLGSDLQTASIGAPILGISTVAYTCNTGSSPRRYRLILAADKESIDLPIDAFAVQEKFLSASRSTSVTVAQISCSHP